MLCKQKIFSACLFDFSQFVASLHIAHRCWGKVRLTWCLLRNRNNNRFSIIVGTRVKPSCAVATIYDLSLIVSICWCYLEYKWADRGVTTFKWTEPKQEAIESELHELHWQIWLMQYLIALHLDATRDIIWMSWFKSVSLHENFSCSEHMLQCQLWIIQWSNLNRNYKVVNYSPSASSYVLTQCLAYTTCL